MIKKNPITIVIIIILLILLTRKRDGHTNRLAKKGHRRLLGLYLRGNRRAYRMWNKRQKKKN